MPHPAPLNILVFAAHPDDEVLGCGATIAKHVTQGDTVSVVILAEGVTGRDEIRNTEHRQSELCALHQSAKTANDILGVQHLTLHTFPDNRMDSLDRLDIVKTIETFIEKTKPSVVYTHHAGDVNIDHRRIHEAVVTACRPTPGHCVRQLLFFEVASSTEWQPPASGQPAFTPNWFVDVSATLEAKLRALSAYDSEMRPWPHARSLQALEHLSRWRGASVGCEAAEAFMLGRQIID